MPLENALYIHELIPTNPDGGDKGSFADDHLRMIKGAVIGTFPNLLGAVTVTHTALNNIPENTNTEITDLQTGIDANTSSIATALDNPVSTDAGRKAVIDLLYPVGSVITAVSNITPPTATGVVWTRMAQGRTLIGEGNTTDTRGEARTFSGGQTGGEYQHQLTVNEMPAHNHALRDGSGGSHTNTIKLNNLSGHDDPAGFYQSTSLMGNTGGNGAHNNIQPYLTVYFWKRTA